MHTIKYFFKAVSLALLCMQASAQTTRWTVKAGESIQESLGDSIIFQYPQFTQGTVYFRDGNISRAPLNLNLYTGEMLFINPSNDTLAIANEATVNYIVIQADTFYFDKAFIKLIHSNDVAKLGKLEILKLSDVQKEGAFGQMNSTSSINTTRSFYSGSQSYKLTEKGAVKLHKETIFFIGDDLNNFQPAVKKNIYKMFSTKMSAVEPFIKENKIVLNKEDDLVELIDFLGKI